jgi:hypothetical protein
MVGVVVKPCGMRKVVLEPSPVKRICPPFFSKGVLWSSWSKASTTRFHSSGVRISTPLYVRFHRDVGFHLILRVLVVVF